MSKLSCTHACSALDPPPELSGWRAGSRRRAVRWGLAFHKVAGQEHSHEHDHMGNPGPARYAGPSRKVFTLGVCGPVGSGKTALLETLCTASISVVICSVARAA